MRERNAFEKAILGNKRALQGGVYNYLGKQKTVNAPLKWKSSPSHPIAFLSYITKEEMDILIEKNIYGSLKGKPNKGPFGLPSLQGSGGGAGGDSGGDSGGVSSADSAAGAGFGSSATGEGGGEADAAASGGGQAAANAAEVSGAFGLGQQDTFASDTDPDNVMSSTTQNEEDEEGAQSKTATSMARLSPIGKVAYSMSLSNPERSTAEKAIGFAVSPFTSITATMADNAMRGVTAPNDYSQATESVQTGSTPGLGNGLGSGLGSFQNTYKPLDNLNVYMPYTRKPFFTIDPLTGVLKSLI